MKVRTKKKILIGLAFALAFAYGLVALEAAYFTDRRLKVREYLTVGTNLPASSDAVVTISTRLAANKGLIVRGVTSQADNLFEAQDVNGNQLFVVDQNGGLTMGTSGNGTTTFNNPVVFADGTTFTGAQTYNSTLTQSGTGLNTFTGYATFALPASFADGTSFAAEIYQSGSGAVTLAGAVACSSTLTATGTLAANGTLDSNSDADFAGNVKFNKGVTLDFLTADPCSETNEYPEGSLFYNSTDNKLCICGDATSDIDVADGGACFGA
jgi:hypothetical protein